MSCLSDGTLRARLDGELREPDLQKSNQHLDSCADCRRRSDLLARNAERVGDVFSALAPRPAEAPSDARSAFARFEAQTRAGESPSLAAHLLSKRLLPAWAGLAAAAAIAVLLTFAPARSWAQQILSMLRVQRITVVHMDWNTLNNPANRDRLGKTIAQMISDDVVVTMKPGQPQAVDTAVQAEQIAGFKVRLLGNQSEPPQIRILGEQAFHTTVNLERLQAILEELGRPDLQFPAALDGATISAHIPKIVFTEYGGCLHPGRSKSELGSAGQTSCVHLAQSLSPIVSVPPELNMAQIAEVGLQLGGMSEDAARRFSRTVDWTSTLVVGIPQGASYQAVEVDGVQGTFIDQSRRGSPRYLLLWVKNGIIYALNGSGDSADALTVAQSLQ